MRINNISIMLCTALLLLSCGTEPIEGYVNQYMGTERRGFGQGNVMEPLPGFTRYEAEEARIFGSAAVDVHETPLYSGGKMVKGLTNYIDDPHKFPSNWTGKSYVKFAVIVPKDGEYTVDVYMNGQEEKYAIVRVNDIENKVHKLNAAGASSWDHIVVERFTLSLWKGLNFICITHVPPVNSSQWVNIDCIDISDGPVN